MTPDFAVPFDQSVIVVALLAIGFLLGMAVEEWRHEWKRRQWRARNGQRWAKVGSGEKAAYLAPFPDPSVSGRPDAAIQLNKVMAARFYAQPLLNKSEARLFRELDRMVLGRNPGWQVMAQVSLGEILRSEDKAAYLCINSKRVDLLLVDELCRPRHALEYQGGGHYQSDAAARDAVKKEALRKAGIGYTEVPKGEMTPSDLRQLVDKLVDTPKLDPHQPEPVPRTPESARPLPAG